MKTQNEIPQPYRRNDPEAVLRLIGPLLERLPLDQQECDSIEFDGVMRVKDLILHLAGFPPEASVIARVDGDDAGLMGIDFWACEECEKPVVCFDILLSA